MVRNCDGDPILQSTAGDIHYICLCRQVLLQIIGREPATATAAYQSSTEDQQVLAEV